MNLSINEIQLLIDGLYNQIYDLLHALKFEANINEVPGMKTYDEITDEFKVAIELLIKFIKLKKEKLAHE